MVCAGWHLQRYRIGRGDREGRQGRGNGPKHIGQSLHGVMVKCVMWMGHGVGGAVGRSGESTRGWGRARIIQVGGRERGSLLGRKNKGGSNRQGGDGKLGGSNRQEDGKCSARTGGIEQDKGGTAKKGSWVDRVRESSGRNAAGAGRGMAGRAVRSSRATRSTGRGQAGVHGMHGMGCRWAEWGAGGSGQGAQRLSVRL